MDFISEVARYLFSTFMLEGAFITIGIGIAAMAGGLVFGLLLALMRLSRFRPVSAIAAFYIWVFRGTPQLLQLVFLFDALPRLGITMSPIMTAIVGFALNEAAFAGEIVRGGINSVQKNQRLAAASLGMSPTLTLFRVVLPQALRSIVPALGNDFVNVVKMTSIASVIAVSELTLRSQQIVASTFEFFPVFTAAAIYYLVATSILGAMQRSLERRLDPTVAPSESMARRLVGLGMRRRVVGARPDGEPEDAERIVPIEARQIGPNPTKIAEAISREIAVSTPVLEPFLSCKSLEKSYGSRQVIKDVNLEVMSGEVVVLMGPSGSGKSTILRLIDHLETVDGGEILVGGRHIGYRANKGKLVPTRHVHQERVDAGVGMVFQSFNLFEHMTVLENLIEAPVRVLGESREVVRERALLLLEGVGLRDHANDYPHSLSGGQAQRAAIARTLTMRPKLILFDEPTSSLDPELVSDVLEVIRALADAGLTMLVVTHEVQFARDVADRVVFMDGGVVVEQGTPSEVLSNPQHARTRQFLHRVLGE
ncbi:amino acid ABC transporter permease/ATP-binding protein [Salinibacterium sp. TMP30]|uniref:amino acid ABC transporter permease/ATP-binding protein n=1 Tax=Salinibacterium sp. TMP30 TaxID=3138237 RepID=UPI00313A2B0A